MVRHNYLAILISAVVFFVIGGVWYTILSKAWFAGIGRTMEEIHASALPAPVTFSIAFVADLAVVFVLSWAIQKTGGLSVAHGIKVAALLWAGLIFPLWASAYAFEGRGVSILAISSGYPLLGMLASGAILGAWKRKARV